MDAVTRQRLRHERSRIVMDRLGRMPRGYQQEIDWDHEVQVAIAAYQEALSATRKSPLIERIESPLLHA